MNLIRNISPQTICTSLKSFKHKEAKAFPMHNSIKSFSDLKKILASKLRSRKPAAKEPEQYRIGLSNGQDFQLRVTYFCLLHFIYEKAENARRQQMHSQLIQLIKRSKSSQDGSKMKGINQKAAVSLVNFLGHLVSRKNNNKWVVQQINALPVIDQNLIQLIKIVTRIKNINPEKRIKIIEFQMKRHLNFSIEFLSPNQLRFQKQFHVKMEHKQEGCQLVINQKSFSSFKKPIFTDHLRNKQIFREDSIGQKDKKARSCSPIIKKIFQNNLMINEEIVERSLQHSKKQKSIPKQVLKVSDSIKLNKNQEIQIRIISNPERQLKSPPKFNRQAESLQSSQLLNKPQPTQALPFPYNFNVLTQVVESKTFFKGCESSSLPCSPVYSFQINHCLLNPSNYQKIVSLFQNSQDTTHSVNLIEDKLEEGRKKLASFFAQTQDVNQSVNIVADESDESRKKRVPSFITNKLKPRFESKPERKESFKEWISFGVKSPIRWVINQQ